MSYDLQKNFVQSMPRSTEGMASAYHLVLSMAVVILMNGTYTSFNAHHSAQVWKKAADGTCHIRMPSDLKSRTNQGDIH